MTDVVKKVRDWTEQFLTELRNVFLLHPLAPFIWIAVLVAIGLYSGYIQVHVTITFGDPNLIPK